MTTPIRTRVETALDAFTALCAERDSYAPTSDFDETVFSFDQGLAELGATLADAVAELLATTR